MRVYDPRVGRFLGVDPLTKKFAMLTPYQYSNNRPIDGIDLDGLEFLKAGTAAFLLSPGSFKANGYLGEVYKDNELIIRNKEAYEVYAKGVEDATKYAEHFSPSPQDASDFKKGEAAHESGLENLTSKGAKAGASGDIITEVSQTIGLVKVFWDMAKEAHDPDTKKNIGIANTTVDGLSKANYLVAKAAIAATFPDKLNTKANLTALVNYITDGTSPNSTNDLGYSNIIRTWGDLIFKNQSAINNGMMNFSPQQQRTITINGPSGQHINYQVTTGNPDPDVKAANDLIKSGVPTPPDTIKQ